MNSRLDLHEVLVELLGSSNVYYSPPPTLKMNYPCIVYEKSSIQIDHANNHPYKHRRRYMLTVIDKDPDSDLLDKVSKLQSVRFDRHFTMNNLNHDIFEIYY